MICLPCMCLLDTCSIAALHTILSSIAHVVLVLAHSVLHLSLYLRDLSSLSICLEPTDRRFGATCAARSASDSRSGGSLADGLSNASQVTRSELAQCWGAWLSFGSLCRQFASRCGLPCEPRSSWLFVELRITKMYLWE